MLNYHSIVKHSNKLINKIIQKLRVDYINRINNIQIGNNKQMVMRILNYIDKLLVYGV